MIRLRQVAPRRGRTSTSVVSELRETFALRVCFNDPGVGAFGLHNALMVIGDQFLEVVSPVAEGTTAGRLLGQALGRRWVHGDLRGSTTSTAGSNISRPTTSGSCGPLTFPTFAVAISTPATSEERSSRSTSPCRTGAGAGVAPDWMAHHRHVGRVRHSRGHRRCSRYRCHAIPVEGTGARCRRALRRCFTARRGHRRLRSRRNRSRSGRRGAHDLRHDVLPRLRDPRRSARRDPVRSRNRNVGMRSLR